ncbi:hypothetical protein RND81_12G042000 [Saponaria officinalis]|uniref:Uncharacterized protein n=1 Tax=Saponaria officinalis TaxID=3572 RepID=A0AAW1H4U8_SAPOF
MIPNNFGSAANGIIVTTEKKLPLTLVDEASVQKIQLLTPNIEVVYSGMGPDSRVLVPKSRKQGEQYYNFYKGCNGPLEFLGRYQLWEKMYPMRKHFLRRVLKAKVQGKIVRLESLAMTENSGICEAQHVWKHRRTFFCGYYYQYMTSK